MYNSKKLYNNKNWLSKEDWLMKKELERFKSLIDGTARKIFNDLYEKGRMKDYFFLQKILPFMINDYSDETVKYLEGLKIFLKYKSFYD